MSETKAYDADSQMEEVFHHFGQAHHMFSRFRNLQIYKFLSRDYLCFVFEIKNADITVYHNRKRHFAAL